MAVRRFDGVDDQIQCSIGATSGLTAITFAAVIRRSSDTTLDPVISQYNSTPAWQRNFHITASDKVGLGQAGDGEAGGTSGTVLSSQGWVLIAASKAAGSSVPRMHRTILSTLAHVHHNGDVAVTDAPSLAGGQVRIGVSNADFGHFDIAAYAIFPKALSDGEVEALATVEALTEWLDFSPSSMSTFHQGTVGTALTDLTGNGANQTAITGTTVLAEEPPIPYEVSTEYSDAGSGAVTLTGSSSTSYSMSDAAEGLITLSGAAVESLSTTDVGSGVLTLSGVANESYEQTLGPGFYIRVNEEWKAL